MNKSKKSSFVSEGSRDSDSFTVVDSVVSQKQKQKQLTDKRNQLKSLLVAENKIQSMAFTQDQRIQTDVKRQSVATDSQSVCCDQC